MKTQIHIEFQLRKDKHLTQLPQHLIDMLSWNLEDKMNVFVDKGKLIIEKVEE